MARKNSWSSSPEGLAHLESVRPKAYEAMRRKREARRAAGEDMVFWALKLRRDQLALLSSISEGLQVSKAKLVREAIDYWLAQFK